MLAPEPYLRAFEALPPGAQTAARRDALKAFLAAGFPTTDEEDWKYTDLTALATLDPSTFLPSAPQASVEPRYARGYGDGLDALNAAFASGGIDEVVPAGGSATLVADGTGHRRHRVRLERGSRATLRLDASIDAAFQTVFVELDLAEGAQLDLQRVQDAADGVHRITRIRARLARDAQLHAVTADFGGRLSRHDLTIELAGPGAQATLHGLAAPGAQSHIDNHTRIDHLAPHCTSREVFRVIAGEKARGVFNGKIVVHKDAQKTDSEQRVASLLLARGAEINAKPELEIYADDVKCAHGATFGQLDEQAVFYLRTRGLPTDAARTLLTYTFAHEILAKLPEPLRVAAERRFLAGLPGSSELAAGLLPPLAGEGRDGGGEARHENSP